ncbi:MAG TPA: SCO family protein [Verrucomicrobiae bacterium]|nr:SCO family protein [Verrucomicrobiae bacterium]
MKMKETGWIWKIVWLGALVAGASAFGATNATEALPPCCRMLKAEPHLTDESLYQADSTWTNDAGQETKLASLAGKPQVVLMFFSRCTSACPILVNDLRRIEAALPAADRAKIGFTLASFDPEHDSPAVLAAYRRAWNLPENWTLLSGTADNARELSALLGVQYRKETNGQFAHSNVITLLNAQGEIVFQQTGLGGDTSAMARHIEELLK